MGADLYIPSLHERARQRYEPLFEKWVERRNQAGTDAARVAAQRHVDKYYQKLLAQGYFRDSYNRTNLLRLFELSWWRDVLSRLDTEDRLSPREAARLQLELQRREPVFEGNLATVECEPGETRAAVAQYFREKYAFLKAFLEEAIRRDEAIACLL